MSDAQRTWIHRESARWGVISLVGALTALLLGWTAAFGTSTSPPTLDDDVARATHNLVLRDHTVLVIARAVTDFGATPVLAVVVLVAIAVLSLRRQIRCAAVLGLAAAASSLIVTVMKSSLGRPRPVFVRPVAHAAGFAFPSGHAANSMTVYAVLSLIALRAVRLSLRAVTISVAAALIAAVAISRVLLGVHWLTDVLAGLVLGAAITCVAALALPPA